MAVASTKDGSASLDADIESRRALVKRVIESAAFAKSERLSSFLHCICDLALSGRANEINEQKIGTIVFGRAPDYDSSIDGIVRPQASRLRHRLDLYFSDEGAAEPVRINLPRGSYVPVFERNSRQVLTQTPAVIPAAVPEAAPPIAPPSEPTIAPARRSELKAPLGAGVYASGGVACSWSQVA